MGFWPSQRSAREVPQDELAVLADRGEAQGAVLAPPSVPRDARHPRRVPLAVCDDVLLERGVHRAQVVLTAGLRAEVKRSESSFPERVERAERNKPTHHDKAAVRAPRDAVERPEVTREDVEQSAREGRASVGLIGRGRSERWRKVEDALLLDGVDNAQAPVVADRSA